MTGTTTYFLTLIASLLLDQVILGTVMGAILGTF